VDALLLEARQSRRGVTHREGPAGSCGGRAVATEATDVTTLTEVHPNQTRVKVWTPMGGTGVLGLEKYNCMQLAGFLLQHWADEPPAFISEPMFRPSTERTLPSDPSPPFSERPTGDPLVPEIVGPGPLPLLIQHRPSLAGQMRGTLTTCRAVSGEWEGNPVAADRP